MIEFSSRVHAQFQAKIWREYANSQWAERVMGVSRAYCLRRASAALAWLKSNRALATPDLNQGRVE